MKRSKRSTSKRRATTRGRADGGGRCQCGCGGVPKGPKSRFLPGHDARVHKGKRQPSKRATAHERTRARQTGASVAQLRQEQADGEGRLLSTEQLRHDLATLATSAREEAL